MELQCHCGSKSHHRLIHLNEDETKEWEAFVQKKKEERAKEKAKEEEKEAEKEKGEKPREIATACSGVAAAADDGDTPKNRQFFNAFVCAGSKIVYRPVVAVQVINPANGKSRKAFATG